MPIQRAPIRSAGRNVDDEPAMNERMIALRAHLIEQGAVVASKHGGRLAAKLLAEPVAVPDGGLIQERRDPARLLPPVVRCKRPACGLPGPALQPGT